MDGSPEAVVEDGSLEPFLPTRPVHVTVSAPFQDGRNIYLAVQVTTSEGVQVGDGLVFLNLLEAFHFEMFRFF